MSEPCRHKTFLAAISWGCPEVRIPANIKMPLLSGGTSPAPPLPHLRRGAPGAAWADGICQQPVPLLSP